MVSPVSIMSSTKSTCLPARVLTSQLSILTFPVLLVPSYDFTLQLKFSKNADQYNVQKLVWVAYLYLIKSNVNGMYFSLASEER